ncbi:trypsin-2-like [Myxocyprinus asiaticus]|uniref:trypsin-2-like n=1 Tax=Myxocyprinus asiaticus TaxID=70543 RepID=UPI002222BAB9|nr:trypsin-2-like [Myxocyprinus asiaticus]
MKTLVLLVLLGAAFAQTDVWIVGGNECEPHSKPWQALVISSVGRCGGSLINENWVVSAAHCYKSSDSGIEVRLGKHNIAVDECTEQTILSEHVIPHPKYNPRPLDNDIMLIKLSKPATLNEYVQPVGLPTSYPPAGTRCNVSGWGLTNISTGDVPDKLQCLEVPTVSDRDCNNSYPGFITESMFCAGYLEGGKGVCYGDSGGGLVCNGVLQGIVSAGGICAGKNQPGIYTKVCIFNTWITETINKYQN